MVNRLADAHESVSAIYTCCRVRYLSGGTVVDIGPDDGAKIINVDITAAWLAVDHTASTKRRSPSISSGVWLKLLKSGCGNLRFFASR